LPLDEIARLETLGGAEINAAKIILATEATTLAHGRGAAEAAAETARKTFGEGMAADGLPTVDIPELAAGIPAYALFHRAGLAASGGEARRLIRGGGARLNDAVLSDEARIITSDVTIKLSAGRKSHVLVRSNADTALQNEMPRAD
jgi:tyrosyl-tRNA synthetase